MPLRIANAAGFLGDQLDAPRRLVEASEVDYLTLEYLAELTLSILARQREKSPDAGYAEDFLDVLRSLLPALKQQPQLKIITNGGGMNPLACARAAAGILNAAGMSDVKVGVVTGDDIRDHIAAWQAAGERFENLDTGEPLSALTEPLVSANAYLGAEPIARALAGGARIVITGRVADASLTLGPAVHEFGWRWDDWNKLAAASVAGHLIECGAQVTGGYSDLWRSTEGGQESISPSTVVDIPSVAPAKSTPDPFCLTNVGYPIAELEPDGSCVLTKPPDSGGIVDRLTVVSQLVYEIGDPRHYLTPDVDCDFTTVEVADIGPGCVSMHGATGRPAPETLKVSLAYRNGYTASGQLLVYGNDCTAKARACGQMILDRTAAAGYNLAESHVECLGAGEGVPGLHVSPRDLREVMLRVTVRDPRRAAVERFTREFAPLITSGPAGLAGYAAGRPAVRPVFAYWPTLVPRNLVQADVAVRAAADWK